MPDDGGGRIVVIGVTGDDLGALGEEARSALRDAAVVAGGRRLLASWRAWLETTDAHRRPAPPAPTIEITADADAFAYQVAERRRHGDVCVLASGDPGFFGVLRALGRVVARDQLRVLPAPSSVSLAFARLGLPWDDAVVVSAHGRPLADAVGVARTARKAAVLTSPDVPPEAVGQALLDAGGRADLVAVCSRLGHADESVTELDLSTLAGGRFDPLSVVVVVGPGGLPGVGWQPGGDEPRLAWGLPERAFAHRDGMVTKAEVRAVALGKLALPPAGILWDVGAGSGSVALECARLRPGLTVFAVESSEEDAGRVIANASAAGLAVHTVHGAAPAALAELPDPDRVFVGGGGLDVLDAALARLRPGGRVVATFTALDRAAAAADRLGHLTQIAAARGARLPDGGWRLAGMNPVFVTWGPADDAGADEDV